ncbi:MAG: acetate--CoA ligase [Phycisphaerales bacterium]|nr:acetate--CoA ligase [Phycisphaerales bacterium]
MSEHIDSVLTETRVFPPPTAASVGMPRWHVASMQEYRALHRRSLDDPEGFWGEQARMLAWSRPWTRVLDWNPPDARWFVGGQLNACFNCVDRQVETGHGEQVAIVWEGEPVRAPSASAGSNTRNTSPVAGARGSDPEIRRLTYRDLQRETSRLGSALRSLGVKKGDVVTIYMPMVPELAVAMLACARIGAAHSIIFGGFAPHAIVERVIDAKSRVIITADGGYRRGEVVPLRKNVDEALTALGSAGHGVEHVITLQRTGTPTQDAAPGIRGSAPGFHDYHTLLDRANADCPCEAMDAEDMLFLLYTSGSTGKPKGIVHTTGGYMVYTTMTARLVFNLIPDAGQLFWCTADIGWVTGHSYVIYGILPGRVPTLMYEGAPNFPASDRFWDIIERHRVTQLYTAPTAIRTFMKWGQEWPRKHDLSSLQLLGTVGEPINPEAWVWYRDTIGGGRCPVVDTYWQTETGGHVISPLPGCTPTKPGSCTLPLPGIDAAVVNEQGEELPPNQGGLLVTRRPWPGMLRGIYGDRQRYVQGYWSRVKGPGGTALQSGGKNTGLETGAATPYYFSADGARRDQDGYFWIMGRVDDVINVSGHRLGTMEVESALVSHPAVAEAAVVGMPHEIKGTGICAFVTLKSGSGRKADDGLRKELAAHVAREIGALARPDSIRFAEGLPKTRSGKIMRRLLRDLAAGVEKITQDTTTLEDYSVLARLRETDE